jgi:hypothetical protein
MSPRHQNLTPTTFKAAEHDPVETLQKKIQLHNENRDLKNKMISNLDRDASAAILDEKCQDRCSRTFTPTSTSTQIFESKFEKRLNLNPDP